MNYTSDHRRTMSYTKISQRFEYFFINLMAIVNLKPFSLFIDTNLHRRKKHQMRV